MSAQTAKITKPQFGRTLVQALVLLAFAVAFTNFTWGEEEALACGLGGAIAIMAQAYFSWRVFRFTGAKHNKQVMSSFYKGEVGKFLIVGLGFAWLLKANPTLKFAFIFVAFLVFYLLYAYLNAIALNKLSSKK